MSYLLFGDSEYVFEIVCLVKRLEEFTRLRLIYETASPKPW